MGDPFNRHDAIRVFQESVTILKRLRVPFFAVQGTALGAWRDDGFVPDEQDIDFSMLAEDFVPVSGSIAKEFVDCGWKAIGVLVPFTRVRVLKLYKNGVKVDLSSFILWKESRFCPNTLKSPRYSIVHDRSMFEELQSIHMYDREIMIPKNIVQYLELEYGPDWVSPRRDSVSKTRVYNFVKTEKIPDDILDDFGNGFPG